MVPESTDARDSYLHDGIWFSPVCFFTMGCVYFFLLQFLRTAHPSRSLRSALEVKGANGLFGFQMSCAAGLNHKMTHFNGKTSRDMAFYM